jgi:hypothetical protein
MSSNGRRVGMAIALGMVSLFGAPAFAQSPASLSADDRSAIQALVNDYARYLADCRAEDYADLFAPRTGYFASGFRGHIAGREELIALVQSERHCIAAQSGTAAARSGGGNGPTVELTVDASGVHGLADLGTAEYQDTYTRTDEGWKFSARTVIIAPEKAAGLDAAALLAIHRLGGPELGNNYVAGDDGVERLLNSGVAVSVADGVVTGRAYLQDGGYRDEVYERSAAGEWRVVSSTYVPD